VVGQRPARFRGGVFEGRVAFVEPVKDSSFSKTTGF
jgi:hypothetical protein